MADITVITLAHLDDRGYLLMVRKFGMEMAILPGGKPELGEDDEDTLVREVREETTCEVDRSSISYLGRFRDVLAVGSDITVEVRLYCARITGTPVASAEIRELIYVDPRAPAGGPFAPSMDNQIFPALASMVAARRPRDPSADGRAG